MTYAKLKQGKTYSSKGYVFVKDFWVEIQDSDAEYFMNSGRFEFAPAGIIPKNDIQVNNSDGVIAIRGTGKDALIITKKDVPEEIDEELKAEEDSELARIREKYKGKSEQKKKAKVEKEKLEAEEKKKKKEQEKLDKKKSEKNEGIDNKLYIQKKNQAKGVL